MMNLIVFVFFKQKTAYEVSISDWSSDVCSSDLYPLLYYALGIGLVLALVLILFVGRTARTEGFEGAAYKRFVRGTRTTSAKSLEIGRASCRERVCQYV